VSFRVSQWVWTSSRSQSTQRLVLLAIADRAADDGTQAYPSTETLTKMTGLSERAVRTAVTALVGLGELKVEYKAGPKGCNRYAVVMDPVASAGSDPEPDAGNPAGAATSSETRHDVHPAPSAGGTRQDRPGTRHETTVDPAPAAPELSENSPTQSVEPSVVRAKRGTRIGTRIPDDFRVTPEMVAWARATVPTVDGKRQTEMFINHWRAASGRTAVKRDWPATWRNWMLRAVDFAPRGSPDLVEVNGHRLRPDRARQISDRPRWEAADRAAIEGPNP
jgi:hypothetical protein